MDDSTLKTLDANERRSVIETVERYRFVFLKYLEAAKELNDLREQTEVVADMNGIWGVGRLLGPPEEVDLQESQALKAEEVLSRLYELDSTHEGFERAQNQFEANLMVSTRLEQSLWEELSVAIGQIDIEAVYGDCEPQIWIESDPEAQRKLIIDDKNAEVRIQYYRKHLRNFYEKPDLPSTLEIAFSLARGSLINAVPFRV